MSEVEVKKANIGRGSVLSFEIVNWASQDSWEFESSVISDDEKKLLLDHGILALSAVTTVVEETVLTKSEVASQKRSFGFYQ